MSSLAKKNHVARNNSHPDLGNNSESTENAYDLYQTKVSYRDDPCLVRHYGQRGR